jgi:hypothetical protein
MATDTMVLCDLYVTVESGTSAKCSSAGTCRKVMVSFWMTFFQYLERPKNPSLEGNMYRLCACCDIQ